MQNTIDLRAGFKWSSSTGTNISAWWQLDQDNRSQLKAARTAGYHTDGFPSLVADALAASLYYEESIEEKDFREGGRIASNMETALNNVRRVSTETLTADDSSNKVYKGFQRIGLGSVEEFKSGCIRAVFQFPKE